MTKMKFKAKLVTFIMLLSATSNSIGTADNLDDIKNYLETLSDNTNQKDYIEKLETFKQKGGDIDSLEIIRDHGSSPNFIRNKLPVLLSAIINRQEEIVEFALDQGADISKSYPINYLGGPTTFDLKYGVYAPRYWNAFELSIIKYMLDGKLENSTKIYEAVKAIGLKKASFYGLQQIHIDCATGHWSEIENRIEKEPNLINEAIRSNSPLWPEMTPLLIASKFYQKNVVRQLVDLNASTAVRDSDKTTPLHYLVVPRLVKNWPALKVDIFTFDERLFVYEEDTFSNFNGLSHFHIACLRSGEDSSVIAEKYLKLGVSPDLTVQQYEYDGNLYRTGGTTAFVLLAITYRRHDEAVRLLNLLLEYNADVDRRSSVGVTSLEYYLWHPEDDYVDFICPLLELGAIRDVGLDKFDADYILKNFVDRLSTGDSFSLTGKLAFLKCVKRLMILDENLLPRQFVLGYNAMVPKIVDFDESSYGEECGKELEEFEKFGLLKTLDCNYSTPNDYEEIAKKFGTSNDFYSRYPVYGRLLKTQIRRRLIGLKKDKSQ